MASAPGPSASAPLTAHRKRSGSVVHSEVRAGVHPPALSRAVKLIWTPPLSVGVAQIMLDRKAWDCSSSTICFPFHSPRHHSTTLEYNDVEAAIEFHVVMGWISLLSTGFAASRLLKIEAQYSPCKDNLDDLESGSSSRPHLIGFCAVTCHVPCWCAGCLPASCPVGLRLGSASATCLPCGAWPFTCGETVHTLLYLSACITW